MEADLNTLIRRADEADPEAAERLFALCYQELHRLAEWHLRRSGSTVTLGATTLLHEVYLSMAGRGDTPFQERGRFLAYASRAMRGLIIDYVRRKRAVKRGRGAEITLVDEAVQAPGEIPWFQQLESLGDALRELDTLDPGLAELVDMHFFCGFTFNEIATLRGVSERTVQRDWRKARLLLQHSLLGTP